MPEHPLLYLMRHGETPANRERRFAGWSDDRLSERGREEAAAAAARLRSEGVRRVFTSPIRRAVETAEILAAELDAEVHTVHGLQEIALGPWKGHTEDEVAELWPEAYAEWRERPDRFRLDGREPLEEVRERALDATDQIASALLQGDDLPAPVVTHLAVLRVLWLTARDRPLTEYHRVPGPHCAAFPVRWKGRGRLEAAGPAPEG